MLSFAIISRHHQPPAGEAATIDDYLGASILTTAHKWTIHQKTHSSSFFATSKREKPQEVVKRTFLGVKNYAFKNINFKSKKIMFLRRKKDALEKNFAIFGLFSVLFTVASSSKEWMLNRSTKDEQNDQTL